MPGFWQKSAKYQLPEVVGDGDCLYCKRLKYRTPLQTSPRCGERLNNRILKIKKSSFQPFLVYLASCSEAVKYPDVSSQGVSYPIFSLRIAEGILPNTGVAFTRL
jgi:hypothetical protein